MRLVIVSASRHHTTHEVADQLASAVARRDGCWSIERFRDPGSVRLDSADAVVIGSPLYAGRWLKAARTLVGTQASALRRARLWTFSCSLGQSSGTAGSSPAEGLLGYPVRHIHLGGRVRLGELTTAERAFVRGIGVGECDTREIADVELLADRILREVVGRAFAGERT